jgi:hypothetical protein
MENIETTYVGDTLLARGWIPCVLVLTSPGVEEMFLKSVASGVEKSSFPSSFTAMLQSAFNTLHQKGEHTETTTHLK